MARAQIKGNLGVLFLCNIIPPVIIALCNYFGSIGVFAGTIIQPAFNMSLVMIFLALSYGERPIVNDVFSGFNMFIKSLWLYFLMAAFTLLWSLLFIVPGIIKYLSYSMAPYILVENPSMDAMDAIAESRKLMQGQKMNFFLLELSFFGWAILTAITFGIAGIYVVPYMQAANANFYNAAKEAKRGELDWLRQDDLDPDEYAPLASGDAYDASWPDEMMTESEKQKPLEQAQAPAPDPASPSGGVNDAYDTKPGQTGSERESGLQALEKRIMNFVTGRDTSADTPNTGDYEEDTDSYWRQRREEIAKAEKEKEDNTKE